MASKRWNWETTVTVWRHPVLRAEPGKRVERTKRPTRVLCDLPASVVWPLVHIRLCELAGLVTFSLNTGRALHDRNWVLAPMSLARLKSERKGTDHEVSNDNRTKETV